MVAIEIKNVTKKYDDVIAVNNLTLSIPVGSLYGFLGPNGAGKTTTLKLLTGFIKPDSGTITTISKKVSFLPDVPGFYGYMTPREFLTLCADINHIDQKDKKIDELLEFADLKQKNRKISSFSRGMLQRLGIAQALITSPDILYLDEPVSALDPIGRKQVLEMLKALKGNMTIFFSTHILADVERVCDYAAIINNGNLVTAGTIDQLTSKTSSAMIELSVSSITPLLISQIESEEVVEKVVHEDNMLYISVKDKEKAGITLIDIIRENHLILYKYDLKSTDLEDVFVKAVIK
ncbi:MAG: ABC transporter ATP-binding protein [Clostridia bacterium]|nr:ABC transporter ATP-binding protein [Clostridia bacterium]